jgi:hypothetical protein
MLSGSVPQLLLRLFAVVWTALVMYLVQMSGVDFGHSHLKMIKFSAGLFLLIWPFWSVVLFPESRAIAAICARVFALMILLVPSFIGTCYFLSLSVAFFFSRSVSAGDILIAGGVTGVSTGMLMLIYQLECKRARSLPSGSSGR